MSLPANWTLVPITGTFLNRDGYPAVGYVTFESMQAVIIDGIVIVPKTITAHLDGNGQISIEVPSTNDPDLNVTGWAYTVTEHMDNGRPPYLLEVPYTIGAIDLATIPPAVNNPVDPVASYLRTSDIGVIVSGDVNLRADMASSDAGKGSELLRYLAPVTGAVARTQEQKNLDTLNVMDFGAVGDGTTDDTAAFNLLTAHLRANFIDTDYDHAGVQLLIPPGRYSVSSWDLTSLLIRNVHVHAHGAVLLARTAGKHVVDMIGSRFIKVHGLTVYSGSTVIAKSGVQIGPKGTETCGNFAFNDVLLMGYYASAPYMNLGAETTVLDNCGFIQRDTGAGVYAQICDGLSTFLPTSDYASITRVGGDALSFTVNNYHGCQLRNEGGGSATYMAGAQGWEFDIGCYHLAFNDAAFVIHGTNTHRNARLILRGSFENNQNDQPTPGNIGIRYAITFTNDGTSTAIDGFTFESSNMHAETFVFRNTGAGSLRLSDADIRVHAIEQSGALMWGTTGSISVDGVLMTQAASKTNLGVLTSFNGIADVDAYSSLASIPSAGSGTIYSRSDSLTRQFGDHVYVAPQSGQWRLLGMNAVAVSHTGNTTETTLATIPVPAGAMGANGAIRVKVRGTCTNNANTKTPRVRLGGIGGSSFVGVAFTTVGTWMYEVIIQNRNSTASQLGSTYGNRTTDLVVVEHPRVTATVSTSSAQDLVITVQLGNAADSISVESYTVETMKQA